MLTNSQEQMHSEPKKEEGKVLRPSNSRGNFARIPGAIAVSAAVALGGATNEAAAASDLEKGLGILAGAVVVGKVIETVRDNNLEEIEDQVGNMRIFIDVEAQKTMSRMNLSYNKARKTIENPSRMQTIHFQNPGRNDIAVQVSSLEGKRIERTNVCAMTPHQLRYTYVYLDKDGKKFGQNVLICKNSLGSIVSAKYKPIPIQE